MGKSGLNTDLMSGSSNDGGKNGSRGIISGKTSLTHTGSIVDNKSGHVVVTHFDWKEVVTGEEGGKKNGKWLARSLSSGYDGYNIVGNTTMDTIRWMDNQPLKHDR